MDVKVVKEKKAALESLISTAIFDYENETGCRVGGVHLMPFRAIGGTPTPQIIVLDVEIS